MIAAAASVGVTPAVDEGLYSRQLYVFGHEAQQKLAAADVLVVGLRGLGVEVAKNIILAGVRSVGLLDDGIAELIDLGSQFYLSDADVTAGRSRSVACHSKLASLNQYVDVRVVSGSLDALVRSYGVVVMTDATVCEQIKVNEICRCLNRKFIGANIYGVLTSIFVDNGDEHVVSDSDGEPILRGLISHVTNANPGVVTVSDDHRHGLTDGMYVTFEELHGMTELNSIPPVKIKVLTPYTFSICDTASFSPFEGTKGYFNQVKLPFNMQFKPLSEALKQPSFTNDLLGGSSKLHTLSLAISTFRESHNREPPRAWIPSDAADVMSIYRSMVMANEEKTSAELTNISRASGAQISPVASFAGGLVGQEVLKACSGKFTPINQFMHYSFSEALPPLPATEQEWLKFAPKSSRYDAYIAMFGADVHESITDQQLFLVGAGAIGCEMLKNWALMGVAASPGGNKAVIVTDMDTIEKSNLNRQFLFRPENVGQLKSQAASASVKSMNPDFRVVSQALRVAAENEKTYNDKFWNSLDGVYTALDNVEARLYVDEMCVKYGKSLVDSGTLGTKGNTQTVVPFLTVSYGSTRDPPEEGIPICTLKNFPHKIEHTIQWARDLFEGDFKQAAEEVNNYLSKPGYFDTFGEKANNLLNSARTVKEYLVRRPLTFDDCIVWARERFDVEFRNAIAQLLYNFPADAKTAEGAPFWSGTKRAPVPISFDMNDPLHLDFVIAAANLHAFNYGLNGHAAMEKFRSVLGGIKSKPFVVRTTKIPANDAEAKQMAESTMSDMDFDGHKREVLASLPAPSSLAGYRLYPVDFEKDVDANFHIAFITACSNLRARNYRIKEESAHMTKFVAGKIIPAIATTTALVTGLVCIEMIKLRQFRKTVESYRCTFVNLAVNLVAAAEPTEPSCHVIKMAGGKEYRWSLWDKIFIDEGNITMSELFNILKARFGGLVTVLNYGATMLYMDFGTGMPVKPHFKARLSVPLSKTIEAVTKKSLGDEVNTLTFEATLTGDDGEDIDIPPFQVKFR